MSDLQTEYNRLNERLKFILDNSHYSEIQLKIENLNKPLIRDRFIMFRVQNTSEKAIYYVDKIKIMEFLNDGGYRIKPATSQNISGNTFINSTVNQGSFNTSTVHNSNTNNKINTITSEPKKTISNTLVLIWIGVVVGVILLLIEFFSFKLPH